MNGSTYGAVKTDASYRAVQRRLAERLPSVRPVGDSLATLELHTSATEAPRLVACPVIEGHALRAVRVEGDAIAGFTAFLDGTQRSRVLFYMDDLPVVHGTVAAVVRVRTNRKLTTWARGPRVERRLYAPCAYLPDAAGAALRDVAHDAGLELVDTTRTRGGEPTSRHPLALQERALAAVKEDRERAEKGLAEAWCTLVHTPLFIDGSVQENEAVATAACVVGVIKSHRTLYAEGDGVRTLLALRPGQRSSVFRIASSRRTPVASWYLRLRDPVGRDPMWGLVRVEAADRGAGEGPAELAARADLLSRWILAEVSPLALPDARWDRMVYGIRDCEEFLKAIC